MNTKESILPRLGTYEDLITLLIERRSAGSDPQHPELEQFVLLGRYYTDRVGGCRKLNRELFTDDDRLVMPKVMTNAEFEEYVAQHVIERVPEEQRQYPPLFEPSESYATEWPLPLHVVMCAHCAAGWDVLTCHDIETLAERQEMNCDAYVGRTFQDIVNEITARTDGVYSVMSTEPHTFFVHNDNKVDESIHRMRRTEAQHGNRSATPDDVVEEGDVIFVGVQRFYHTNCLKLLAEKHVEEVQMEITRAFKQELIRVGFRGVRLEPAELPEDLIAWAEEDMEPGEDPCALLSFFRVHTEQGKFGVIYFHGVLILYLSDSGITVAELHPEMDGVVPTDIVQMIAWVAEEEQLLRLWQLFTDHTPA